MRSKLSKNSKSNIINVKYTQTKTFLKLKFLTFISFEVYTDDPKIAREFISLKKIILFLYGLVFLSGLLMFLFSFFGEVSIKSSVYEKNNLDKELRKLVEENIGGQK